MIGVEHQAAQCHDVHMPPGAIAFELSAIILQSPQTVIL